MRIKTIILLSAALLFADFVSAQDEIPGVSPTATYTDDDGNMTESTGDLAGQAPLSVTFKANPKSMAGHHPVYEWHFQKESEGREMMVRYEEDTQYTFLESGTIRVTLKVTLQGEETELDPVVFRVTISESKLSFPNAFSPNGDGINDIYKAKEYQSLVEFHAYIFNRWGQKLYDWTDPAGGWDGTYQGKDVKDGTYYVLVKAKGADGRNYHIRKDVNILRGYIEGETLNE